MTQVSNESDFRRALAGLESPIEITSDFSLSSQVQITYDVLIKSVSGSSFTLTRGGNFFSYLIRISGGSLTLEDIVIDGDKASHPVTNETNRSLIFVTGGSLILGDGAVLQNNNASREGGGVYLSGAVNYTNTMVMKGNAAVLGCHSESNGGGIMFAARHPDDSITITDEALIQGNSAPNGGGLYFRSYDENTSISVTVDGRAKIANNIVTGNGGGLYFSGFRNNGPLSGLAISGKVTIYGNRAVNGGGLFFFGASDGDRLQIQPQVSILQNTASQNGGAIMIQASAGGVDFNLNGADILNNTAGTGGGIYLLADAGATVSIAETVIRGNRATDGISGSGGGLWMQNRTTDIPFTFSLENTIIEENSSSLQGGGIALWGGPGGFRFDAHSNTVNRNTAQSNGGGMLLSSSGPAVLTFEDNTISENTGNNSGGGIYFANLSDTTSSRLEMKGDTVTGNTAGAEGGGIRLTASQGSLEASLTGCIVSANTAQGSNGGGIWAGGAGNHLTLQGVTIVTENAAEDRNGGGIYFNSTAGSLTLTGPVKVTDNRSHNRGGGICSFTGRVQINDSAEIAYNTAQDYGGGISASESAPVTMTGGTIHDNTAFGQGGGFWNRGDSFFTMTGGSIYGNQAKTGGAIYNDSSSTVSISAGALIGSPKPNTAAEAPGIYNAGLFFTSGSRDISNGVYLTSQNAAVRIDGSLEPGSIIQLNNSSYVTANGEGIPIVVAVASPSHSILSQADADAFRKPSEGFDGWEIRLSDDHTQMLLAPQVYTIHYENLLGAENPNPSTYTITTPDLVLVPPGSVSGCEFIGWFDAPAGGNQITVIPSGSAGDITLYARWQALGNHTVTFRGNDEWSCPKACLIPRPITVQAGGSVTIPKEVPFWRCHRFIGWNTASDGSGTFYLPGDSISNIRENIKLYAIWQKCWF